MTYDEALAYWFARINYEVRAARPADLKLERMRALLRQVGDPHRRYRIVHITGTKGKGSTAAMLASILQAAGYRVGLFTSPHLCDVRERIVVNGQPISREELAALMADLAPAVRRLGNGHTKLSEPTFFEIGTALGFLHFCRRRCDLAVVEVGLGGRFDSTNVCSPVLSIITSIGYDHMAQLGSTLEAIAFQKAGIIKRRIPVVCGVTQNGPRQVIETVARQMEAPIYQLGEAIRPFATLGIYDSRTHRCTPSFLKFDRSRDHWPELPLGLLGEHQVTNATLAVAAVEELRQTGMPIPDKAVAEGLAHVRWPGRFEIVEHAPVIILDVAHNVPSIEALIQAIRQCIPGLRGRKHVIFAASSDKQYTEMLRLLAGHFDWLHLCRYQNPRSVPPEKLVEVASTFGAQKRCFAYPTSLAALQAVRQSALPEDLICITGSLFLVGELRPQLVSSKAESIEYP